MKISAIDEYGLRILLRIAREGNDRGLSIAVLSEAEGLSEPYVAKITRLLRLAGYIKSTRGKKGGYVMSKDPATIHVSEVLYTLDGKLYDAKFCADHSGANTYCTNSVDCSVRSLWQMVQKSIDQVLTNITIADLTGDGDTSGVKAALRMMQRTPAGKL